MAAEAAEAAGALPCTSVTCIICAEESGQKGGTAVYSCSHVMCATCAARLRMLQKDFSCPMCKQESKVAVVDHAYTEGKDFGEYKVGGLDKRQLPAGAVADFPTGLVFLRRQEREDIVNLRRFRACVGGDTSEHSGLRALNTYLRHKYKVQVCEICIRHGTSFVGEIPRRTPAQMRQHRDKGDKGTGFKGHPVCDLCSKRVFDSDALRAHRHKDHFSCQVCSRGGHESYYADYETLAHHFRSEHFMCEHPDCQAARFVVFASAVELKAHVASTHPGLLSREERTLTTGIAFHHASGGGSGGGVERYDSSGRRVQERGRGRGRGASNHPAYDAGTQSALGNMSRVEASEWETALAAAGGGQGGGEAHFPTLGRGGSGGGNTMAGRLGGYSAATGNPRAAASAVAAFPTLGGGGRGRPKKGRGGGAQWGAPASSARPQHTLESLGVRVKGRKGRRKGGVKPSTPTPAPAPVPPTPDLGSAQNEEPEGEAPGGGSTVTAVVFAVQKALQGRPEKFEVFRRLVTGLRAGEVQAKDFHDRMAGVLPTKDFLSLFPRLVSSLPDPATRTELAGIHLRYVKRISAVTGGFSMVPGMSGQVPEAAPEPEPVPRSTQRGKAKAKQQRPKAKAKQAPAPAPAPSPAPAPAPAPAPVPELARVPDAAPIPSLAPPPDLPPGIVAGGFEALAPPPPLPPTLPEEPQPSRDSTASAETTPTVAGLSMQAALAPKTRTGRASAPVPTPAQPQQAPASAAAVVATAPATLAIPAGVQVKRASGKKKWKSSAGAHRPAAPARQPKQKPEPKPVPKAAKPKPAHMSAPVSGAHTAFVPPAGAVRLKKGETDEAPAWGGAKAKPQASARTPDHAGTRLSDILAASAAPAPSKAASRGARRGKSKRGVKVDLASL